MATPYNAPREPGRGRRTDAWLARLLILSVVVNLTVLLAVGLVSTGVIGNGQRIEGNAAQIADTQRALDQAERGLLKASRALRQVCGAAERDHARAVRQLTQTRDFLRAAKHGTDLYDAVVRALPDTRAEVGATRPPRYCAHQHATLPPPPSP